MTPILFFSGFILGILTSSLLAPLLMRLACWILEPDYIRCDCGEIRLGYSPIQRNK
jgi:hypothetical protein